ncbi:hypothetical protein EDD85DRAFT_791994 [Armillaria nabsnona]|nr:hypothetical protein EDD85DRAFT_791994 [Armillaria nabsnona]
MTQIGEGIAWADTLDARYQVGPENEFTRLSRAQQTRFNRHGYPSRSECRLDASCTLLALSAQLSVALSTLVSTQTLDVADSTNTLRLSRYNPSYRPTSAGWSLKPWLRTSAHRMKDHLIHHDCRAQGSLDSIRLRVAEGCLAYMCHECILQESTSTGLLHGTDGQLVDLGLIFTAHSFFIDNLLQSW